MDRLLTPVRSRSWLLLLPSTRHLSSFKPSSFELKSEALVHLVKQFERSKQKSFVPSLSNFDSSHELNHRFPLPGHVGVGGSQTEELLTRDSIQHRNDLLDQFIKIQQNPSLLPKPEEKSSNNLDIHTYDCPPTVASELSPLFLNYDASTQPMTVITMVFPTKTDMSTWSLEVEAERKQLTEQFTTLAQEISTYLTDQNYWVDFIDPSNGKPYYGPSTSDALFETDERLRHFGINTVDLGCCRVIEHLHYGTNVFIGCIFTSASKTDPQVEHLLENVAVSCYSIED